MRGWGAGGGCGGGGECTVGPPGSVTMSATGVKRSSEPACGAVCRGQTRTARFLAAKDWLDEGVGSFAFSAGAVKVLLLLFVFVCLFFFK